MTVRGRSGSAEAWHASERTFLSAHAVEQHVWVALMPQLDILSLAYTNAGSSHLNMPAALRPDRACSAHRPLPVPSRPYGHRHL